MTFDPRLALATILLISLCVQATERAEFTPQSPAPLQAVGRLLVPGYEYVDGERQSREEHCSATLVGPATILTAWHCLEFYRDLSRDPLFSLPSAPALAPVAARRLADGGGMSADWALLRLRWPVNAVSPVPVSRYPFGPDGPALLLAGFARDPGLGRGGQVLTWEADCREVANDWYRVGIDCVTFKGASGGPVFMGAELVGVVSAGDSEAVTFFAPSSLFLSALRLHRR